MDPKSVCSGVILAGGLNSRLSGRNKALLDIGGKSILERVVTVFASLFDEIILVTNDPLAYAAWDVTIVTDLYDVRSSLTGLHTGLFYANRPYAFFAACDAPYINPELVRLMLAQVDEKTDVIVPQTEKGQEPLFAIYSKRCLKPFGKAIEERKLKISRVFAPMRIKAVPEAQLRKKDPELRSFFNVNTPEDLAAARQMVKK